MTPFPVECPVVIVGAGPTGLTAGLLLAAYGVRSIILERNAQPLDIPRAIVLDDEGARVLQVLGLDKTYVAHTIVGNGAAYVDDAGRIFARSGAGPETFGFAKRHFINQPEMETALRAAIAQSALCTLHFGAEVTATDQDDSGVGVIVATADGQQHAIRADCVIAADGGRSPIRARLGIGMQGSTYGQEWIVIDTMNDSDQTDFTRFYCSNERPHVSVPAPNGGRRYEFMLLPGETHEQVMQTAFVQDLLRPYRPLDPADIIRKTVYTFHARIADRWRDRRILLAGDAAHLTPPFAGQGMNAGLRDVSNLAWKIAALVNGGTSAALLDSYELERHSPAWSMIQLAVVMGEIVMPIDPGQIDFRERLLSALKPFPAVQDYLVNMKFKPRPRHEAGLHLGLGEQPFDGAIVGEMIAQPDVVVNGQREKLDTLLGAGFAMIAQDNAGARALASVRDDRLAGLPLSKVYLPYATSGTTAPAPLPAALTDDPRARQIRAHRDQVLLVRPDRYCTAAFAPDDLAEGLRDYMALMA